MVMAWSVALSWHLPAGTREEPQSGRSVFLPEFKLGISRIQVGVNMLGNTEIASKAWASDSGRREEERIWDVIIVLWMKFPSRKLLFVSVYLTTQCWLRRTLDSEAGLLKSKVTVPLSLAQTPQEAQKPQSLYFICNIYKYWWWTRGCLLDGSQVKKGLPTYVMT